MNKVMIQNSTDETLIEMIRGAKSRVVLYAPGVSFPVAQALIEKNDEIKRQVMMESLSGGTNKYSFQVVLDISEKTFRRGLVNAKAIKLLWLTERGFRVSMGKWWFGMASGIQMGCLTVDDRTLFYVPSAVCSEGDVEGCQQDGMNSFYLDAFPVFPKEFYKRIVQMSSRFKTAKDLDALLESVRSGAAEVDNTSEVDGEDIIDDEEDGEETEVDEEENDEEEHEEETEDEEADEVDEEENDEKEHEEEEHEEEKKADDGEIIGTTEGVEQFSGDIQEAHRVTNPGPWDYFEVGESMYYKGGDSDLNEAVYLFRRAAGLGHVEAMTRYGECLLLGDGVPCDFWEAKNQLSKAESQGSHESKFFLEALEWFGEGTLRKMASDERVRVVCEKAAEFGSIHALYRLGRFYERKNEETGCDFQRVLKFYQSAADGGIIKASDDIDRLKNRMSADAGENEVMDPDQLDDNIGDVIGKRTVLSASEEEALKDIYRYLNAASLFRLPEEDAKEFDFLNPLREALRIAMESKSHIHLVTLDLLRGWITKNPYFVLTLPPVDLSVKISETFSCEYEIRKRKQEGYCYSCPDIEAIQKFTKALSVEELPEATSEKGRRFNDLFKRYMAKFGLDRSEQC